MKMTAKILAFRGFQVENCIVHVGIRKLGTVGTAARRGKGVMRLIPTSR